MNKLLTLTLPLAASILLVGCGSSSNDDSKTPQTPDNKVQKFTSSAQWFFTPKAGESACFDFDGNAEADCAGNTWDIKYTLGTGARDSAQFYTNSGPLASGKGGALGDTFNYSWAELEKFPSTDTDDKGEPILSPMFLTDSMKNAFASDNAFGGAVFEYESQKILSKYTVFLVTLDNTADYDDTSDNIYAVQFVDYYGGANGVTSGHPTIRYIPVSQVGDANAIEEIQVNASANWTYLNLKTGEEVSKSDTWQLGFNRYNVITNSGDSGSGKVGTFVAQEYAGFKTADGKVDTSKLTDSALIADAKNLLTNNANWNAPSAAKDWDQDTLTSALNPEYTGSVMTGLDYGFYLYTGMNASHPAGIHKFVANPENGVLLRSGEGNSYARVRLSNIDQGSGQYTFDFDVAPAQ